jgi:hypothetical protein
MIRAKRKRVFGEFITDYFDGDADAIPIPS